MKLSRNYLFELIDYSNFYDLYPGYSSKAINGKDYYFNTKKQAIQWVDIVKDIFESFPSKIKVYRTVYFKNIESLRKDDLGESWSWERDSAIEFGVHAGNNYILSGIVNRKNVDWKRSIEMFVVNSSDPFSSESENELYIPFSEEVIKDLKIEKII